MSTFCVHFGGLAPENYSIYDEAHIYPWMETDKLKYIMKEIKSEDYSKEEIESMSATLCNMSNVIIVYNIEPVCTDVSNDNPVDVSNDDPIIIIPEKVKDDQLDQ